MYVLLSSHYKSKLFLLLLVTEVKKNTLTSSCISNPRGCVGQLQ